MRTASRSTGGVWITDSSRSPDIAICRVRGIGVAVRVRTWTSALHRLQPLLVGDSETLLLVDDDEAELLELDRLGEERVGADDDVDLAGRRGPRVVSFASLAGTSRESRPISIGKPWKRSLKVL